MRKAIIVIHHVANYLGSELQDKLKEFKQYHQFMWTCSKKKKGRNGLLLLLTRVHILTVFQHFMSQVAAGM